MSVFEATVADVIRIVRDHYSSPYKEGCPISQTYWAPYFDFYNMEATMLWRWK